MITRNLIKKEIDKVEDSHLEVLYRIVKALETPSDSVYFPTQKGSKILNWKEFIETTYGCMAHDPIYRGEQGQYGVRKGKLRYDAIAEFST